MRLMAISLVLLLLLPLGLSSAPAATAQQLTIKPGGSYIIRVQVHKPSYVKLPEDAWEVRVYFFVRTNCYNTGSWWQSGSEWIYSGWYNHRIRGEDWSGGPEDKTFNITVNVVDNPRPQEDINRGMNNIPVPGTVSLRARFLIKDINAKFSGPEEAGSGYVTFTVGGTLYQYRYVKDEYGNITITGEGFEAKIDQDFERKWRLMIDQTLSVTVSNDAPSTDLYSMPSPINVNLLTAAQSEPAIELPLEFKIMIGVVVVMAVVAAAAYIALRKRMPAEELGPV
ncbi:MAG: hypothetical protein QMD00_02240 [Hadesarchaea archaeon]|nr:hypothetical protein [Hadesarchaea archaeon]